MGTSYSSGDSDWTEEENFSHWEQSAFGIISLGRQHWTLRIWLDRRLGHLIWTMFLPKKAVPLTLVLLLLPVYSPSTLLSCMAQQSSCSLTSYFSSNKTSILSNKVNARYQPIVKDEPVVAWCCVTAAFERNLIIIINTVKEKYYTEYDKKYAIWKTFLTVKTQICFVYAKESEGMT